MKNIKSLLIVALVIFLNVALAQNDSLTSEYLGFYSATIGDEDSGNEAYFVVGVNEDKFAVYKGVFSETHYATYYKIISFDKKTGKLVAKSELVIFVEDELTKINKDSTIVIELFFVRQGNKFVLRTDDYYNINFIKEKPIEAIILSKKGTPIKAKL
jgi:hypothetical protein